MNGFRITILVLLCLAVGLMFYAVMVIVPGWQNQYSEYQASMKIAEYQQSNDHHRQRMEQFSPDAEAPEVTTARTMAEESARKDEQALNEAEESNVIAAARRKEEAALARQAEAEAEAPKPLGLVAAYNPEWNSLMIRPVAEVPMAMGFVVAVRRAGSIVCEAVIDGRDEESGQYSATVKAAELGTTSPQPAEKRTPAVGDEVIETPFPSSQELRRGSDFLPPAAQQANAPSGNAAPAPLPSLPSEPSGQESLPELDATLTPVP